MIVEQLEPKPLTDSEQLIIDEITAGGVVFFKPRKIKVTRFEGVPDSWQGIFNNEEDYAGWITFNRLQRLDADLMEYFSEAVEVA